MIGVIIVDYNSESLLCGCLTSLVALGREDLRYYVADNGGSLNEERLTARFPGLAVLAPGRNLGFAGGCNLGIAQALADGAAYCLLINPDAVAEQDFIEPLLEVMENDSRVGMACPTLLGENSPDQVLFGGSRINWWSGRPYMVPGRRRKANGRFTEVPFVTGAAMLLRTAAVEEVGPIDETYFLYFEDTDYTRRFVQAGWKAVYVPDAEVRHGGSGIIGFRSETYLYYFARNRIRFMRRWGRWYHRMVFTVLNTLFRLPAMVMVFGILPWKPRAALAYLSGYLDGMRGRSGPRAAQASVSVGRKS